MTYALYMIYKYHFQKEPTKPYKKLLSTYLQHYISLFIISLSNPLP